MPGLRVRARCQLLVSSSVVGRFSIVGTTVTDPETIPVYLVDEKHSWRLERIYIPTTVAAGCILEVDVAESADTGFAEKL